MTVIDVEDPHVTDLTNERNLRTKLPAIGLGAIALGAGGRLLKHLFDLGRSGSGTRPSSQLPAQQSAVTEVPVEVGEEEAAELERRGIRVRRKLAEDASAVQYRSKPGPSSIAGGLGLGAGTVGLGMGAWYLTDRLIDAFRRRAAKSDIDTVRSRIEKVLSDEPDEVDEPLYGQMKAAEDFYFSQPLEKQALGLTDIPWLAAVALGGGTAFNMLSGYNESARKSPYSSGIKKLKSYLNNRAASQPQLTMAPYVVQHPNRDEEDEKEVVEDVVREKAPAPQPAEAPAPAPAPATVPQETAPSDSPNWF